MATLIVRKLDDDLVQRLKARAKAHGRSAEAEHRLILQEVLVPQAQDDRRRVVGGAARRTVPFLEDDDEFFKVLEELPSSTRPERRISLNEPASFWTRTSSPSPAPGPSEPSVCVLASPDRIPSVLFLTATVVGELALGIAMLAVRPAPDRLEAWLRRTGA